MNARRAFVVLAVIGVVAALLVAIRRRGSGPDAAGVREPRTPLIPSGSGSTEP